MFFSIVFLMIMATKSEYRSYLTFVMSAFRPFSSLASNGYPVLFFVFHIFAEGMNKKLDQKLMCSTPLLFSSAPFISVTLSKGN